VSRWFPDSLRVRVSAEALECQLVARKTTRASTRTMVGDESGTIVVQSICDALEAELADLASRDLRIEIGLHSSWVRFCLIPWSADFTSRNDRVSFAQHCFFETYGELARRWTIQSSRPAYGNAALGAAIDSELLAGLARSAQKFKLRLAQVRPCLTERIAHARQSIKEETFWFVLADTSNYSLLLINRGAPALIQVVGRREASLETLLERAWRSSGLEQDRCRVYLDFGTSPAIETGESRLGWNIARLPSVLPAQAFAAKRVATDMAL
jgi:hypothetical protein